MPKKIKIKSKNKNKNINNNTNNIKININTKKSRSRNTQPRKQHQGTTTTILNSIPYQPAYQQTYPSQYDNDFLKELINYKTELNNRNSFSSQIPTSSFSNDLYNNTGNAAATIVRDTYKNTGNAATTIVKDLYNASKNLLNSSLTNSISGINTVARNLYDTSTNNDDMFNQFSSQIPQTSTLTTPQLTSQRTNINIPPQRPQLASQRTNINIPPQRPQLASQRTNINIPPQTPQLASQRTNINIPPQRPQLTSQRNNINIPPQKPELTTQRINIPTQSFNSNIPSSGEINDFIDEDEDDNQKSVLLESLFIDDLNDLKDTSIESGSQRIQTGLLHELEDSDVELIQNALAKNIEKEKELFKEPLESMYDQLIKEKDDYSEKSYKKLVKEYKLIFNKNEIANSHDLLVDISPENYNELKLEVSERLKIINEYETIKKNKATSDDEFNRLIMQYTYWYEDRAGKADKSLISGKMNLKKFIALKKALKDAEKENEEESYDRGMG